MLNMSNSFPVLESRRLLLRQIIDTDLEAIYKGLSHPEIIQYYGVQFSNLEATKEQMNWYSNLENTRTGIWWAICSKKENHFLGAAGLNNIKDTKAEIGFWLYPEHWRQGIMKEAVTLILDYAFHMMRLEIIEGYVETENSICKQALQKMGFQLHETLLDCEIKNGKTISLGVFLKEFNKD
jgi:[ribosomal protein S5]-alanine N-acetyltransferase